MHVSPSCATAPQQPAADGLLSQSPRFPAPRVPQIVRSICSDSTPTGKALSLSVSSRVLR